MVNPFLNYILCDNCGGNRADRTLDHGIRCPALCHGMGFSPCMFCGDSGWMSKPKCKPQGVEGVIPKSIVLYDKYGVPCFGVSLVGTEIKITEPPGEYTVYIGWGDGQITSSVVTVHPPFVLDSPEHMWPATGPVNGS